MEKQDELHPMFSLFQKDVKAKLTVILELTSSAESYFTDRKTIQNM